MDTPRGTVVSVATRADHLVATVDVDVSVVCARCAAGKGCGAGVLTGTGPRRQVEAVADAELRLSPGDTVEIGLEPRNILRAALVAYGAPLAGALIGAAVANGLSAGDATTAVAGLAGVVAGMVASRLYLKRPACMGRFEPTVSRVI